MRTVATAGHVDHGKSSIVLALTGTDPDRFPEEKSRGLTIDLGFAFATLPSGARVGFVDVPGHVRFIKNMLAGVGAVDVALLVVAASEGWMPQSEEHLRILGLLDVRHGVVALTKADLVDDDVLAVARSEVEERLARSTLARAELVVCDSVSGRGMDALARALDRAVAGAPAPRDEGRPRLWVDRVFTVTGAGTVVTGTLTGGGFTVGDAVDAGGRPARVRGIETAGAHVEHAAPGARVALNLAGVGHDEVARGDAVVTPEQWITTRAVDVRLVGTDGRLRRGRYQAHVGSGEHTAWLRPLDRDGTLARVRLGRAVPLAPGDRVVLRDSGRRRTVAGAEVLDVAPVSRPRIATSHLVLPLGPRLLAAHDWLPVAEVGRLGGLSETAAAALVDDLLVSGAAERIDDRIVASTTLTRLREDARAAVLAHHAAHPHDPGLDAGVLADRLGVSATQLRAALVDDPELAVVHGTARHRAHAAAASDGADGRRVLESFEAAPFSPPAPTDTGADPALVRALVREGRLIEVDGVVFAVGALERAREIVVHALRERGRLTVSDVRDLLGSTRKYVVPIVGWLDREGVTRRRGDERVPGPRSGIG